MKKIVLVALVSLLLSACGNIISDSVPSWAQGIWYTNPSNAETRIKVCEITSSQYIAYQVSEYDGSYNPIVSEAIRLDCTDVTNDTVTFGGYQARKLDSANQLSIGAEGVWMTVYK